MFQAQATSKVMPSPREQARILNEREADFVLVMSVRRLPRESGGSVAVAYFSCGHRAALVDEWTNAARLVGMRASCEACEQAFRRGK